MFLIALEGTAVLSRPSGSVSDVGAGFKPARAPKYPDGNNATEGADSQPIHIPAGAEKQARQQRAQPLRDAW